MVLSNLITISLSADKTVLSLGPSYRWGDVYKWLTPYNLSVPGGRLSPVGVPDLLLAGGINFYGNQKGFSADSVIKYEVVLADGSIVCATKSSYPDLFWALKGGSSNFGIVTRFDIKTVPSTKVYAGVYSVSNADVPRFISVSSENQASKSFRRKLILR
jgi:FAD/FMN-containing dehydrogenase